MARTPHPSPLPADGERGPDLAACPAEKSPSPAKRERVGVRAGLARAPSAEKSPSPAKRERVGVRASLARERSSVRHPPGRTMARHVLPVQPGLARYDLRAGGWWWAGWA